MEKDKIIKIVEVTVTIGLSALAIGYAVVAWYLYINNPAI